MDEKDLPGRSLHRAPAVDDAEPPEPVAADAAASAASEPEGATEPAPATRGFRTPEQQLTVALLRAADLVQRRMTQVTESAGIPLQQYNVLRILAGAGGGPLMSGEIGDRLIERTPGTTRLLDRLEESGLIRRERSKEDRRVVLSRLAPRGRKLLEEVDPRLDAIDRAVFAELEESDRQVLVGLLTVVRRSARGLAVQAPEG